MFDNFVQEKYHSYDRVFTHPVTGHAIFIGDVQAALDLDFLMQNKIHTGKPFRSQWSLPPGTWIKSSTEATYFTSYTPS